MASYLVLIRSSVLTVGNSLDHRTVVLRFIRYLEAGKPHKGALLVHFELFCSEFIDLRYLELIKLLIIYLEVPLEAFFHQSHT